MRNNYGEFCKTFTDAKRDSNHPFIRGGGGARDSACAVLMAPQMHWAAEVAWSLKHADKYV